MTDRPSEFQWDEASEARLRDLYGQRLSHRQIAETLTAEFGVYVNRNASIGKCHRLKLPRRTPPASLSAPREKPKRHPMQITRGKVPPPAPMRGQELATDTRALHGDAWSAFPGTVPIPLLELTERTCKWPTYSGDEPRTFCGLATAEGSPYCLHHQMRSRGAAVGGIKIAGE